MTIIELLENPIFNLPKYHNNNSSYELLFIDCMNEYIELLSKLENFEIYQENVRKINSKEIKEKALKLGKGIIRAVREYNYGKPHNAFNEFKSILDDSELNFKTQIFLGSEDFFRVRVLNNNYSITKREIFHIPFESRSKISTQRYSIPGFPSLYLSDSIYTCWEEMKRPDVNHLHSSRFKLNSIVTVLDIPHPKEEIEKYVKNDKIVEGVIGIGIDSLLTNWPLYLACSIGVKNINDPFKIEYVIPQLLLQYVRQNNDIQGIKYFSTNIDYNNTNIQGNFNNYVFPVQETKSIGVCEDLSKIFSLTEPISLKMIRTASSGQIFLRNNKESDFFNVKNIEMVKGESLPYSYSSFGQIERKLKKMPDGLM